MTDPLLFVLAVLATLGTPGPTNTLLMTSGATVGFMRSLPLLVAEVAAYNVSVLSVGILLRPWIDEIALLRNGLRIAAAAYLVKVALDMWRSNVTTTATPVTIPHLFVTTLLNPKVLIFALIVIPLQGPNALAHVAAFSLMVVIVGGAWVALGAAAGGIATGRYTGYVPKAAAFALGGFALALFVSPFMG